MGSMRKIMEQEATTVKGTSAHRSREIVKRVPISEFSVIDTQLKPILEKNQQALIDAYEAAKEDWVR